MNGRRNALSPENLSDIYDGWGSQSVQSNLSISFFDRNYTSAGATGRGILVNTYNWTITDGGQV
jgi:hypothetical protein